MAWQERAAPYFFAFKHIQQYKKAFFHYLCPIVRLKSEIATSLALLAMTRKSQVRGLFAPRNEAKATQPYSKKL